MKPDKDAWLAKPQPSEELCRLFHGIDCHRCRPPVVVAKPPFPFPLWLVILVAIVLGGIVGEYLLLL